MSQQYKKYCEKYAYSTQQNKLTDYLSKTTNYYDKALSEVAKKTTQADKK